MGPKRYYSKIRNLYPHAVTRDNDTGIVHLTTIDAILTGFAFAETVSMTRLRPPEIPFTGSFGAIFPALSNLAVADWRPKPISPETLAEEKAALDRLLANGETTDLIGTWVRPSVSRLIFELIDFRREEPWGWSTELYDAAYAVVAFLDDKYLSEQDMVNGLKTASAVIDAHTERMDLEAKRNWLARFVQFATGHETPANIVANCLLHGGSECFGRYPIGALLSEAVRIDPPNQCLYRTARADFKVESVDIQAGSTLALHMGLASRDPSVFSEAEKFDPGRKGPKHTDIFFGNPSGGCPGRHLGLMVANSLLNLLASQRWESLSTVKAEWISTSEVRGVDKLVVRCASV